MSLIFMAYIFYYAVIRIHKVAINEIETSQSNDIYYNITSEEFNPFQYGFNFGMGFQQALDPSIATISLSIVLQTSNNNV